MFPHHVPSPSIDVEDYVVSGLFATKAQSHQAAQRTKKWFSERPDRPHIIRDILASICLCAAGREALNPGIAGSKFG